MKKQVNRVKSFIYAFMLAFTVLISTAVTGFSATETASAMLMIGEVSYSGSGDLYGYTTNYVKYGGSFESQHRVYDGWQITAYDSYYSHGVTWYECWDTDDGDYYGWIDGNYLWFYSPRESSSVSSYSITPKSGQISGDGVYGYTSNYVLYGGSQETQHKVQNNWHITAYNTASSHGVTWYECWDTDDGDYYGWVDAKYISFYSDAAQSPVVVTVTVPVIVTVTVPVTVTEPPTTAVQTTTAATESSVTEFSAVTVDNDNKNDSSSSDNQMIIFIVAASVIALISVSALVISLISRRPK